LADIDLDLAEILDVTSQNTNFDQMEQDIEKFASEPPVRAVLEVRVDLQNSRSEIGCDLGVAEVARIDDYLPQIPRVEQLHQEIMACDQALAAMEDLLNQFKGSLGQLWWDICSLQTRSQLTTVRLQNRKSLDRHLGEFTCQLTVTKDFNDRVCEMEVGPSYVKVLEELHRKLEFVHRKNVRGSLAAQESKGLPDRLRAKAADKVCGWLIARVADFRSPEKDKFSIQNVMIRCPFLFRFLRENAPDVQQAARDQYVKVVAGIYLEQYRGATHRVLKQMVQDSKAPERSSQAGAARRPRVDPILLARRAREALQQHPRAAASLQWRLLPARDTHARTVPGTD
jgi:hypothetical protein